MSGDDEHQHLCGGADPLAIAEEAEQRETVADERQPAEPGDVVVENRDRERQQEELDDEEGHERLLRPGRQDLGLGFVGGVEIGSLVHESVPPQTRRISGVPNRP